MYKVLAKLIGKYNNPFKIEIKLVRYINKLIIFAL